MLFGVPCLLSHDRLQRRTYYVLTDRMAYIAYRPARKRGVWRIAGFAIHPGMVVRVKRYRNGSVDYILGMEKINKARRWRGFMNIQPENDPGPLLEQLGVVLPGKERSGKNPILFEWPSTPLSNMVWGWLVLIIGSVLLYVTLITERNMLFVTGQETDAAVVNFIEKTEQRRGRYTTRTVLVYYPVVVYQTLEGDDWIAETSPGNTREPEYELGEKVKLLYDPHDPSRCEIKDYGVLGAPALMLLLTGFGLWPTIVSTRTWYRRRNTLAVVLCMNSSTGEIREVVLGHPVPDVSVPAQPELP